MDSTSSEPLFFIKNDFNFNDSSLASSELSKLNSPISPLGAVTVTMSPSPDSSNSNPWSLNLYLSSGTTVSSSLNIKSLSMSAMAWPKKSISPSRLPVLGIKGLRGVFLNLSASSFSFSFFSISSSKLIFSRTSSLGISALFKITS